MISLVLLSWSVQWCLAAPARKVERPRGATLEEQEVIRLTNEERSQHHLPPIKMFPLLVQVARSHSREMCDLGYFDHISPTPGRRMAWNRVESAGIKTSRVAENIFEAEGYPVHQIPEQAIGSWMRSSGERANILDRETLFCGVGICVRGDSVSVTQVFVGEIESVPDAATSQ